jgi:hypothetical protein
VLFVEYHILQIARTGKKMFLNQPNLSQTFNDGESWNDRYELEAIDPDGYLGYFHSIR